MRLHEDFAPLNFAATFPQIADEFFARVELRACRLVTIEIADQTNSERDVVQIVAVDVPAVDLAPPAIAYFDLTIACRSPVPDHEMIRKPVLHPANVTMVIIERLGVSLTRPAVVHDNELPATPFHRGAPDRFDD